MDLLTDESLLVAPADAPAGAAQELQRLMARFSDGPEHARRRDLAITLLPPVDRLADSARTRAAAWLAGREGTTDVMPLAHEVPTALLAELLGATQPDTVPAIRRLCEGLVPDAGHQACAAADAAARDLLAAPGGEGESAAARIGLLLQTHDATAALIATAFAAGTGVETTLAHEPPVRWTRRRDPGTGEMHRVDLDGRPFGAGAHACPGAAHATGLARGVLEALADGGWRPVAGQLVPPSSRPNFRLPASLLAARS